MAHDLIHIGFPRGSRENRLVSVLPNPSSDVRLSRNHLCHINLNPLPTHPRITEWHESCTFVLAREEHSAGVPLMFLGSGEEKTEMDVNYVFLCGVMWCRFGQQDAGKELLRATNSVDPDMKALAWAMLAKGARRLRDLEGPTPTGSRAILEGNLCG